MMIYLYLLIFLGFFAFVAWRNLRVALYLILLFIPAYLLRFEIFSIPTTLLELLIYTAFIIWVFLIVMGRYQVNWLALKYYLLPITLIFIGLVIGTLISSDRLISLGIIKGWFVDPILLFVIFTSVLSKRLHVKKAIIALLGSALFLSLVALWQVVSGNFITIDGRASAFFESANYLSLYLVPIIILSIGFVLSLSSKKRFYWLIGIILMLAALYFTFSYSGWLSLMLGTGVLLILFLPLLPTLLGMGALLATGILSQLAHPKFQQMLDLVGHSSSHVRLQVWQSAWLMIKENYFWGIGLGLFEKKYPEFANRLFNPPLETIMLHSHNLFICFWLNLGIVGLIGFIILIIKFFGSIWRMFKIKKDILTASIMAAMIAILVHGLFDTPYWKNDLAILFWVVIAFSVILNQRVSNGKRNLSHRH